MEPSSFNSSTTDYTNPSPKSSYEHFKFSQINRRKSLSRWHQTCLPTPPSSSSSQPMGPKSLPLKLVLTTGFAIASCAIAATFVTKRIINKLKWKQAIRLLNDLRDECDVSVPLLKTIADEIAKEMHAGLEAEGGSMIKMLPTYICSPPQGTEIGNFYGLDFGGTHYRIVRIELLGKQSTMPILDKSEKKVIPEYVKIGTCEEVFDFIALELKKFVESEGEVSSCVQRRELGFSFSFPVKQRTVSSGNLIKWTKGFAVADGVHNDVADCLQQAMDKIGLHMRVAALVNDTVSTFCFGRFQNQDTVAAVVIGTGTNACYLEKVGSIVKRPGLLTPSGEMVVNMEWGDFFSAHLPKTSYDESLDRDSSNPNEHGFEKMISGMYLGDIVRGMVLRVIQEVDMKLISNRLSKPFTLTSELIADMNEDESPNFDRVARIFKDIFGISSIPIKLRRMVVDICDIVARRSAGLAAAGIVGIFKKLQKTANDRGEASTKRIVVVLDGGVYNGYSSFRKYLHEAVASIVEEDTSYMILSSMDLGPVVGAALIAASHSPIYGADSIRDSQNETSSFE